MIPLQQTSTLVTPPHKNIFLTPSDNSYTNWSQRNIANSYYPIGFSSPNNNKIDVSHEYLYNCKGFLDFPQEIPTQYDAILQPHVYASMVVNPRLQDDISHITVAGNGNEDTNHKIVTNTIKSQWTPEEDKLIILIINFFVVLVESVRRFGLKKWSHIAKLLNGRVGKQCRERWFNHLRPNIRKDSWSEEEDLILIEAHKVVGNKWAKIAKRLVGRTENTVKNHWNATKRSLNTKRRVNKCINPNGELLLNYIKQITNKAVAKKEVKKSMSENHNDINFHQVVYKNSENVYDNGGVDWLLHSYAPSTISGNGSYVPMMVNDGEIASGSGMKDI
ncbi:putative transcription factor MYB-HB-like family [Lupinus albus]|uniref:Putative transcription factor MYB-HB-like family n=1 Tax=Lupinus albus TaxID=3870 RepID=A0A6A4QEK5_LUPAL|nr:putative transcription factor MYB-HB-like family [Lupinus albus]